MKNNKDSRKRKTNYKKLRKAGFNSYESNRYKDLSADKMIKLIASRHDFNNLQSNIIGGK